MPLTKANLLSLNAEPWNNFDHVTRFIEEQQDLAEDQVGHRLNLQTRIESSTNDVVSETNELNSVSETNELNSNLRKKSNLVERMTLRNGLPREAIKIR